MDLVLLRTTGLPKRILHSRRGIILEHLKWLGLHNDVGAGARLFRTSGSPVNPIATF